MRFPQKYMLVEMIYSVLIELNCLYLPAFGAA